MSCRPGIGTYSRADGKAARIGELDVVIATLDLEHQVSDLGEIVSRAAELQRTPATFAIFSIAGRTDLLRNRYAEQKRSIR